VLARQAFTRRIVRCGDRSPACPAQAIIGRWGGGLMAYVGDWEPLSAALSRVMAAGLSKPEAQRDICRAIDLKIRCRFRVEKAEISDAKWFGEPVGSHVAIPADLSPDFDWRNSRPKRPWRHGGAAPGLIELFSADVTLVLCGGRKAVERSIKTNSRSRPKQSFDKKHRLSESPPRFEPQRKQRVSAATSRSLSNRSMEANEPRGGQLRNALTWCSLHFALNTSNLP
jgi:hypothetical protein